MKTDSGGDEEWNKTFGGTNDDCAYSIQQTSDGGYIIAGGTCSHGAGYYDFWLVKTDSGGDEEWNRTFGGTGYDYAISIQQTSDDGYIIAGGTRSYGAGYYDSWLVKTDSGGNEEWNRTFGGTDYDCAHPNSLQQTSDGGYILAGFTYSNPYGDFWLVKTDSGGNEEWNKTFGGTDDDRAYSIQQTSDGGYILAGFTESYGAGGWDFWLVKTDSGGNHEWDRTFGGTSSDCACSVHETSDGGYIIAGYTRLYGAGGYDFWLIKLSPEDASTLTITAPTPNTTTHSPIITITGTASDSSGIASVTVNGVVATGTTSWSVEVTLTVGENAITVVATDGAGLTMTATITVWYEPLRGDLNSDGTLTAADAAIALQIAIGSRPCDAAMLAAADVSGDKRVNSLDALMIMQAAGGIEIS